MIHLSESVLNDLPTPIKRPKYDRSTLKPGIVHIGLGNFQRAHQAWYLQQLFNLGQDHDWAVVGAGVRPYDTQQREKFLKQDCLSTLIELAPSGISAEIVGSMVDYVPVEDGNTTLIRRMADKATRIVTLTVTEGGYYINPSTGEFDASHPDIRHDIANIERPRTAFGAIVAALKIRRTQGITPFTCQSCDNLQGNGTILHRTIISLASRIEPGLAEWIDTNGAFPCSMVDCIVPATGPEELALVRKIGIDDAVPVTHENFRQWVIEDDFCAGRPDWSQVGVTFSDRVQDYETMKIRMLNAGHQIIAIPGEILSIETVSDCISDPLMQAFFRKVQSDEIMPHIKPVPDITPENYLELLVQRFANPALGDTTRRVCFDGTSRHAGFILPIVRNGLISGTSVEGLALVEAFWARMCEGIREDGSIIEPNDPFWNKLQYTARLARNHPRAWLEQSGVYGDLADAEGFVRKFENWLSEIWSNGCESALRTYTSV